MAARAYKMTTPLLKNLCDLFDIDRKPQSGKSTIDKDTMVDRLLDFLGAPSTELTRTHKEGQKERDKEGKTAGKKRARSTSKEPNLSKEPNPSEEPNPKKKGKKEAAQDVQEVCEDNGDDMDFDEDEEAEEEKSNQENNKMPSDKSLRKWVRAYVNCFDLDKATTKHAIATASSKFGMDLSSMKGRIKELLTEEMS